MNIAGTWDLSMKTPMGAQKPKLVLAKAKNEIIGTLRMPGNPPCELTHGKLVGATATMQATIKNPTVMNMVFSITFAGSSLTGTCTAGTFQPFPVTGILDEASVDRRGRLKRWKDFMFG